ncbi:MAG: Ribosomal protein S12 methylthiotransferase RimO [Bacteroidetes bacterium ADurb.Bin217]|nr:MAG: Ribosomal protein S12 methylthiotransferase RimO [Bacteroidetes bacterium ADurb.Bin217]
MGKTVNIITLGCSKNTVDSERLARQLAAIGYSVSFDSNDFSEVVIINTCGFIHDAKEESIEMILQAIQAKEAGEIEHVYVIGCLSERYANDLRAEIPEVDSYFGSRGFIDIVKELHAQANKSILHERIVSTPKHFSYLKLAEGCNRSCAFCAIPAIRGAHVSEPIEQLVAEATYLQSVGVKELSLISQDLSYYGYDIYKKNALRDLLEQLLPIQGLEWLRLHYLYPNNFPLEVLDLMNNSPKICKYIDIPFQHISDLVLSRMRRGFTEKETWGLIENIKKMIPNIAIRTTLIVGHPGETELEFNKLHDFVKQAQFDRLGVFTYSHEEGTYAGEHYKNEVPERVKQERLDILMNTQQDISLKNNMRKVGTTQKVIIDRKEQNSYIGRTQFDAYEVDNEVLINTEKQLEIGGFYDVEIIDADVYDVFGKI